MKTIKLINNNAGGIDLITERDAGNEIRILTGRTDMSLEFWEKLHEKCEAAIEVLQTRIQDRDYIFNQLPDSYEVLPQSALDWIEMAFGKSHAGPLSYGGSWLLAYYKGDDPETAKEWIIVTDNGGSFKVGAEYMVWYKRADADVKEDHEFKYVAQALWSDQSLNNTIASIRNEGPRVDDPDYQT